MLTSAQSTDLVCSDWNLVLGKNSYWNIHIVGTRKILCISQILDFHLKSTSQNGDVSIQSTGQQQWARAFLLWRRTEATGILSFNSHNICCVLGSSSPFHKWGKLRFRVKSPLIAWQRWTQCVWTFNHPVSGKKSQPATTNFEFWNFNHWKC